jgi:hypothetical protein
MYRDTQTSLKNIDVIYNDFTLLFQGPLHKNFVYGLLNNYKEYTPNIVISHWDTDDIELLEYLTEYDIPHTLVTNQYVKQYNVYHNQNVYYQVYTTQRGLQHVTTPYVLKMRTDQWYGNLIPMFAAVRSAPHKYTCANLHFRPDNLFKYHPSDKLIGMSTELLRATFDLALHRVTNEIPALMAGAYMYTDNRDIISEPDMLNDLMLYSRDSGKLITNYPEKPMLGTIQVMPAGYIGLVPEMVIGTSFLLSKGIYPSPANSIPIVKEHFQIVRVEDMIPYVNKDGTNRIEHNSVEINYIEDYG